MSIIIEIYTNNSSFISDFLGKSPAFEGTEIQISNGIRLRYDGSLLQEAIDFPSVAKFILIVGEKLASGKVAGIIAAWLHSKFTGKRIVKITINRREIEIDEGKIKRVVEEEIKVEREE